MKWVDRERSSPITLGVRDAEVLPA